jgi:hypothetical protein
VDAGVQLDTVYAYDTSSLSQDQKTLMEASGADSRTDDLFPEGTIFFLKGQRLDLVWKAYRQVLGASLGSSDFDEAMRMFEQQYGFNPDSDLFPYLNGEWSVGLMPSSEGLLAKSAKVNLGFALLAETDNPSALRATVDSLRPRLEEQGAQFSESEAGGVAITQLGDPSMGSAIAAYGVSDRYLALGSSSQSLEKLFSGGASLARSSRYSQVWRAFPRGMSPVIYIDIEGAMSFVRESLGASYEATQYLTPIKFFALASSPLRGGVGKSTMILFIPTE